MRDDELRVTPVGGGEIDGIEGAAGERFGKLLVGEGRLDAVFFRELLRLDRVAGDDGRELTELPVCSMPGNMSSWAMSPAPTTA